METSTNEAMRTAGPDSIPKELRPAVFMGYRPPAVGTEEYYDTRIDCAAVKSTDGQVWTGKRHHHCIATILQAGLKVSHGDQGFVTMNKRYVSREEAAALVLQTRQCNLNHPPLLYSEDLY